MSERGVFAMCRGWFDHPCFAREPYTEREAWAWLISEAAWKPVRIRIGSGVVAISRGQLSHSLRFMAQHWQWQHDRVRRFLQRLEKHDMIATAVVSGQTVVTICNYNKYQRVSLPSTDAIATAPATAVRQQCDKEEDIEDIKDREGGTRSPSISPEAFALAAEFLTAIGVDPKAPELAGMAGAPYVAQMWLTRGYERALILATAADIAAREGPRKHLNYYTKCLETAHSKRPVPGQRNLPLLATINGGSNEGTRRNRAGGSAITAAIDAHIESFERAARDERETREAPPRMLSGG